MKQLGIIAIGMLFSVVASAADDCRLTQPVDIGTGNLVEKGLFLRDVKFNEDPLFVAPSKYVPATDVLNLDLFQISLNNRSTKFLGASVGVEGKNESQGFAPFYTGIFNIQGSTSNQNGVVTYTTKSVSRYTEPQHSKSDAVTEVTVTVDKGKLISVRLTTPVFKVWKVEDQVNYIAFTGEHQTLCLKSAK